MSILNKKITTNKDKTSAALLFEGTLLEYAEFNIFIFIIFIYFYFC